MNSDENKKSSPKLLNILNVKATEIVDVFHSNFQYQMSRISQLIETYPYIAMDTQFPGVLPTNNKPDIDDQQQLQYQTIRESVLQTNLIQIGISISDENGNVPQGISTWQFNFRFDKEKGDQIIPESENLLVTAGIKFEKLKKQGIEAGTFSQVLMGSDLISNENVVWVQFHGGFDQIYLTKYLLGGKLPQKRKDYISLTKLLFPNYYDIKSFMQDEEVIDTVYKGLRSIVSEKSNLSFMGLAKLADTLQLERIGPQHQAGSDSLLTLKVYFKLLEILQNNNRNLKLDRFVNSLCTQWRFSYVNTSSSNSRSGIGGNNGSSINTFGQTQQQNLSGNSMIQGLSNVQSLLQPTQNINQTGVYSVGMQGSQIQQSQPQQQSQMYNTWDMQNEMGSHLGYIPHHQPQYEGYPNNYFFTNLNNYDFQQPMYYHPMQQQQMFYGNFGMQDEYPSNSTPNGNNLSNNSNLNTQPSNIYNNNPNRRK